METLLNYINATFILFSIHFVLFFTSLRTTPDSTGATALLRFGTADVVDTQQKACSLERS